MKPRIPLVDQPSHLGDREIHVPDRQHGLREQAFGGLGLDVDVEIVEELQNEVPLFRIVDGEDVVRREAHTVRVYDLRVHTHLVHQRDGVAARARPRLAVDVPMGDAVVRPLLWHAISPALGSPGPCRAILRHTKEAATGVPSQQECWFKQAGEQVSHLVVHCRHAHD